MIQLLLYSLIGGLFSLIGGLLLLWNKKFTQKIIISLISFGVGAFLSAALVDILPEAIEMVEEVHPLMYVVLGVILILFSSERLMMKYLRKNNHDHDEHTETLPLLLIAGDSLHNFMDGIVIALAYVADPTLGLTAALAIAAHEIPQEIGDFSILLHLGWKKAKVIWVNILQSLATVPGVFIGYFVGSSLDMYLPYLLAGTAGIFIYIAASDLIPMLHHQAGHKYAFRVILPMIAGAIAVSYLSILAHN